MNSTPPPRQILEKYSNIKFSYNTSSGSQDIACVQTDRQMDKYDEANSRLPLVWERAQKKIIFQSALYICMYLFIYLTFITDIPHWCSQTRNISIKSHTTLGFINFIHGYMFRLSLRAFHKEDLMTDTIKSVYCIKTISPSN